MRGSTEVRSSPLSVCSRGRTNLRLDFFGDPSVNHLPQHSRPDSLWCSSAAATADCVGFARKKGEFLCSVCGTKTKGRRGKRPHGPDAKSVAGNKKRKPAPPPAKAQPVGPVFLARSAASTRLRVEVHVRPVQRDPRLSLPAWRRLPAVSRLACMPCHIRMETDSGALRCVICARS
jgi:hypothetical protein